MTGHLAAIFAAAACSFGPGDSDSTKAFVDPAGDAFLRRTDLGADGPVPPDHIPDLLRIDISGWSPTNGVLDPFTGVVVDARTAHTFRLDVVIAGLVNPPGPVEPFNFDSMRFGPRPLVAFIDLDIDGNRDTGGELGGAAEVRYLANIARFGGLPANAQRDRAARSADDLDLNFFTDPQIERTGADFSLVLCGCFEPIILSRSGGNQNDIFEAGETWVLLGRFFERAKGYRNASAVFGGSAPGLYDPLTRIRFSHNPQTDQTTISLVFALDMIGAAMLQGGPIQSPNFIVSDHASIEEAVLDLVDAANGFLFEPERTLTRDWRDVDPNDVLDVTAWRITALVGTPYALPEDTLYVWSDVGFDTIPGDFNGDGKVDQADIDALHAFISHYDGSFADADGVVNGIVVIPDFGWNFSLFDLNYDGTVSLDDLPDILTCPADLTTSAEPTHPGYGIPDGQVDAEDFFYYLDQFVAGNLAVADLTGSSNPNHPAYGVPNGILDIEDLFFFLDQFVAGCF
ncbi:MAG: hypothetical protein KIT24_01255 [Phycisphaeraceae bacterium]|nr:hypothetical protein [Phycisphaeraceae bacterium]